MCTVCMFIRAFPPNAVQCHMHCGLGTSTHPTSAQLVWREMHWTLCSSARQGCPSVPTDHSKPGVAGCLNPVHVLLWTAAWDKLLVTYPGGLRATLGDVRSLQCSATYSHNHMHCCICLVSNVPVSHQHQQQQDAPPLQHQHLQHTHNTAAAVTVDRVAGSSALSLKHVPNV
jgi:hypothetical protein